jgi:hypothetical protein
MIVQAGFNKAGIVNKKYYSPWMAAAQRSEKGYKTKYLFLETTIAAPLLCVHERNTPAASGEARLARSQRSHTHSGPGSMRIYKTPASQAAIQRELLYLQKIFVCQKKHCGAPQWARDPKREEIKPFYCQPGKMMHGKRLAWNWFEMKPAKEFSLCVRPRAEMV